MDVTEVASTEVSDLIEDSTKPVGDMTDFAEKTIENESEHVNLVKNVAEPVEDTTKVHDDSRPPSSRQSYGGLIRDAKNATLGPNAIFDAAMLMYKDDPDKSFKAWITKADEKAEGYTKTMEFKLRAWSDRYQLTSCVYDRAMCVYIIQNRIWEDFFHPYCREKDIRWDAFRAEFKCGNTFLSSFLCKVLKKKFIENGLVPSIDACARNLDE
ncbi:hypothetical protein CYMTET_44630 [Cymbomonas tetramitiformis]|uniref:Uncharacterized protein n=1 Tax=Cymbomonas tetramitiformis TaxID=36881 RepID=A0AAE0C119_9CHLO|nr:hypothetical protein CYMTET_44630 [Cymbomonas tetramitiformis]|eukprot:gene8022-9532_t